MYDTKYLRLLIRECNAVIKNAHIEINVILHKLCLFLHLMASILFNPVCVININAKGLTQNGQ